MELTEQQWKGMDGATAWHLIDRHADGWADVGKMMVEWLAANSESPIAPPASEQKPFGYYYEINGTWDVFIIGKNEPPDDSYDTGSLRAFYAAPQPDYKAQRDALLGSMKILRDIAKGGSKFLAADVFEISDAAIASVKGGA